MPEYIEDRYKLLKRTILSDDPNFDRANYELVHVYHKDGFLFFSFAHKNGEGHVFEIYKDKDVKLEEPEFIKNIQELKELYNRKRELDKRISEEVKELGDEKPYLSFEWLKEFLVESPDSSFEEQRRKKWYKRAVLNAFYKAVKFMGYESEWHKISKMLPDLYQLPKEKMELYCGDKTTLIAYQSLFGELWSDKPYPSIADVAAEMAHVVLQDYVNQGCTVKLNSQQKEHIECVEELVRLHIKKLLGYDLKRSSLTDKEIKRIQRVMRFGPEDPHAGYYEATLELVEKIERMSEKEKRKTTSYDGYKKILRDNAKTLEDKFWTALNMANVMYRTGNNLGEQKRNLEVMKDLLIPNR